MDGKNIELEVFDEELQDYVPGYPKTTQEQVEGLSNTLEAMRKQYTIPEDFLVKLATIDDKENKANKGKKLGYASRDDKGHVPIVELPTSADFRNGETDKIMTAHDGKVLHDTKLDKELVGVLNGLAPLDNQGAIPWEYLPGGTIQYDWEIVAGEELWDAADPNGNYYFCDCRGAFYISKIDGTMWKYNRDGELLWEITDMYTQAMAVDEEGQVYAARHTKKDIVRLHEDGTFDVLCTTNSTVTSNNISVSKSLIAYNDGYFRVREMDGAEYREVYRVGHAIYPNGILVAGDRVYYRPNHSSYANVYCLSKDSGTWKPEDIYATTTAYIPIAYENGILILKYSNRVYFLDPKTKTPSAAPSFHSLSSGDCVYKTLVLGAESMKDLVSGVELPLGSYSYKYVDGKEGFFFRDGYKIGYYRNPRMQIKYKIIGGQE